MDKIDFVITWVDGSDPFWIENKKKYAMNVDLKMNDDSRFRDWEFLKYWFRSIETNASWVNKVFFITEGHIPSWLNVENDKLVVVRHDEYIKSTFLPTFNSNVIELNIHKIKGLSDKFVLFNDDMFINKKVEKSAFFKNGLPVDSGIFSPQIPKSGGISSITSNNIEIINKYFDRNSVLKGNIHKYFRFQYGKHLIKNFVVLFWNNILGFYDTHIPISYKKSTFEKVWSLEESLLLETTKHRFRTRSDINHWLMRYWQLCEGDFSPKSIADGKYYNIDESIDEICNEILNPRHKFICLNDGDGVKNFEFYKIRINRCFAKRYPIKSSFEI